MEEKKEPKQLAQRIVVEIFGDTYPLKTDNPEHLEKIAANVDLLMKRTARRVNSFDGTKIAVLSALQLAEEYHQLKKDYDELVELLNEK